MTQMTLKTKPLFFCAMFQLEKYKGKKTRYSCPTCGERYQFACYIDEQGQYLADDVGICNRVSKCGYHYTPKQYFADHPSEHDRHQSTQHTASRSQVKAKPDRFDTIPQHFLDATLNAYDRNGFVQFLLTRFDADTVTAAIARYFVGTTQDGRAAFWQVDQQGEIRTGKLIAYDASTGKRDKRFQPDFAHARLKRGDVLAESFELRQCFFGEHLLQVEPHATVALVEAEKTAVIASLILPEFIWLATTGKQMAKPERLAALGKRGVILFPDGDGYTDWMRYAEEARTQGLDVECSDLIESGGTSAEKAEGFDLADYLLASIERQQTEFTEFHAALSDDDQYALDERAAIYEYEAGFTRSEAEQMALAEWQATCCEMSLPRESGNR